MAPSTRRSYASSQAQFISFCRQLEKLHPSGLPCPADEWTLCLFVTFLARTIKHSSIKMYLSGVRALHIDHGFPDPLINCLRLQRVVRGIKRCQGSSSSSRLPITDDLMQVIWQSLDLHLPDHCMFWAACSLGYFGFLRASEFLGLGLGLVSLCRYVVVLLWFWVTGAWGQVGDRRYHVTPVRGSSFLQAPREGF